MSQFQDHPLTITADGLKLDATLCAPTFGERVPMVLMIPGSGPIDRNENMPGQRLDIFNTIARTLAECGIASVRYDKRGVGASEGDYYSTGHVESVSDAIHCYDVVRALECCRTDRIFLLGHSEGTLIAPQVSADRPDVAGLVLICPVVENLESVLLKQARHIEEAVGRLEGIWGGVQRFLFKLLGAGVPSQKKLINRLKTTDVASFRSGMARIPAKCLRELIQLDPAAIMRQIRCPALLIGGEKDLQCAPEDVGAIAGMAQGPVNAHVVPNLTHLLRLDVGVPSILGKAELLREPMAPVVLELIQKWIVRQVASDD